MKNLLTGIRPTGNMHIGHYFGTIKNWVELQEKYNSFFVECLGVFVAGSATWLL